jgi:hypothetical protein
MRRSAKVLVGLGGCTASIAGLLFSCLPDPREDEAVVVLDSCDTSRLSADSKTVDPSLKAYYEASKQLLAVTREADLALRDACLEIYKDPDLKIVPPAIQDDAKAKGAVACQPLIQRIVSTIEKQPAAEGLSQIPAWIQIQYGQRCTTPAGSREACLAACTGACDLTKCERPELVAGKCTGECLGTCTTIAPDLADPDGGIPCKGSCVGEIQLPSRGGYNPGSSCLGECTGTCGGGRYTGNCAGGCTTDFKGICAGTCHGKCNGVDLPEKTAPVDAGPDAAPPSAQTDRPKPLDDDTNNCGTGICEGSCSHGANGSCLDGRCVNWQDVDGGAYFTTFAPFSQGECTDSVCIGTCRSALGSGSVTALNANQFYAEKCLGECTELTKGIGSLTTNTTCTGTCRVPLGGDAGCSVPFEPTTAVCEGALNCGQNRECANACEAKAALDAVCVDPLVMQAYSVTDPILYKALQAHGKALGKAVALLRKAQRAYAFIGNRNYGDFVALAGGDAGLPFPAQGDLATACMREGTANTAASNEILVLDTSNDPTIVRTPK